MGLLSMIIIVLTCFLSSTVALSTTSLKKIEICQNKECCQRFRKSSGSHLNLVEVVEELMTPSNARAITIESTGCLSSCDKGPNVKLTNNQGRELLLHGVENAAAAVAELETASEGSLQIPSKLLAAAAVIARAEKASSFEEKDRFLTSVIAALEGEDELKDSLATARAYASRGEARYEARLYDDALKDAQKAIAIVRAGGINIESVAKLAFRVAADTYRAKGNLQAAKEALMGWAEADPQSRTKVAKEIAALEAVN